MRFEKNLRSSAVVGEADFCAVMRESVSTHSLKQGVNYKMRSDNHFVCEMLRLLLFLI
jgi:hypothetical protein